MTPQSMHLLQGSRMPYSSDAVWCSHCLELRHCVLHMQKTLLPILFNHSAIPRVLCAERYVCCLNASGCGIASDTCASGLLLPQLAIPIMQYDKSPLYHCCAELQTDADQLRTASLL